MLHCPLLLKFNIRKIFQEKRYSEEQQIYLEFIDEGGFQELGDSFLLICESPQEPKYCTLQIFVEMTDRKRLPAWRNNFPPTVQNWRAAGHHVEPLLLYSSGVPGRELGIPVQLRKLFIYTGIHQHRRPDETKVEQRH